ncbi:MAG: ABC transporter substrate-binding protein [Pseudomonadota bacterium]
MNRFVCGRADGWTRRAMVKTMGIAGLAAPGIAGSLGGAWAQSTLPFPAEDARAKPGGVLRIGMPVAPMVDPALTADPILGNQFRPVVETLSLIGPDNIAREMLATGWKASSDLTTWDLTLREGVFWHNGEELIADHIAWNIRRWFDREASPGGPTGLNTIAALSEDRDGKTILSPGAVEVTGPYELRLRLREPVLSVMEDLARPATAICHPSFRPPFSANTLGTGPFSLEEITPGEACILERVDVMATGDPFRYWGEPVYLDEIHFYDPSSLFESGPDAAVEAYGAGDVDVIAAVQANQFEAVRGLEADISTVGTATTFACRMNVNEPPFTSRRVREAIVRSIDNAAVKNRVLGEIGEVGANQLVAPVQPDSSGSVPPSRDLDEARELLAEEGFPNGLFITLDVRADASRQERVICEAIRDQVAEAGIRLTLRAMPSAEFDASARTAPFAARRWQHRTLGAQTLLEAARPGGLIHETGFVDSDFDEALGQALATRDLRRRRTRLARAEKLLQDAFLFIQPLYFPVHMAASARLQGIGGHPDRQIPFHRTWIE